MAYTDEVLADNPTRYYRLGELVGTNAVEQIAASNATYRNTPTLGVACLPLDSNKGVEFDSASSEYADRNPDAAMQGGQALTLECWIIPRNAGATSAAVALFGSGSDKGYWFNCDHNIQFWISTNGSNQVAAVAPDLTLQANVLQHLVGTYDGIDIKLFYQGQLIASTRQYGTIHSVSTALGFAIARLGAVSSDYFDGVVDEVAIYQHVLSDQRIYEHYLSGIRRPLAAANVSLTLDLTPDDLVVDEIISASIEEAVGTIATLQCQVPRAYLPDDEADIHALTFSRELEGDLFSGYLKTIDTRIDKDGAEISTLVCDGAEVELVWANSYRAIIIDALSPTASLDLILVDTDWAGVIEGSGFPAAVTRRFDDMTKFDCVINLAKILQGFVRFDNVNKVVTISNTAPNTGLSIEKTSDLTKGILGEVKRKTVDKSQIYNKILPMGVYADNLPFDLRDASLSSPYTINSFKPISPRLTAFDFLSYTFVGSDGVYEDSIEILCTGRNCAIIAVFLSASGAVTAHPQSGSVKANGRVCFREESSLGGSALGHLDAFTTQVPEGVVTVSFSIDAPSIGSSNDGVLLVFALSDVRQINRGFATDFEASGGTTTPSVSIATTIGNLLIDVLSFVSGSVTSHGTGQVEITPQVNDAVTNFIASYKIAVANPDTLSWVKSSSSQWHQYVMNIPCVDAYYIEDAASIAANGARVKNLTMSDFRPIRDDLEAAADALYMFAADYLTNNKDPKRFYDISVIHFPLGPLDWSVGSKVNYIYEDDDIDFVVPQRKQIFDSAGYRRWELELSSINAFMYSFVDTISQIKNRLDVSQANQV